MRVKQAIMLLAGLGFAAATAQATGVKVLSPDQARTYGLTDPLRRASSALGDYDAAAGVESPDLTADDSLTVAGGTEVVWQVIGSLATPPGNEAGEAYCGQIPLGDFVFSGNDHATSIRDLIGVVRFDLTTLDSSDLPVHSAAIRWNGSNLGVRLSLSVSLCEYGGVGAVDREGADNDGDGLADAPDCIVDNDNFAGGSFAGINDINLRKGDNNVGLVGGISDINFGDVFPSRDISLNGRGVAAISREADVAKGGSGAVTFIIRCADEDGHTNGFLGGQLSNALILHDPNGIGFPGNPASLQLVINHNEQPTANDEDNGIDLGG